MSTVRTVGAARWSLPALVATVIACSGDSPTAPTLTLPSEMRLEATALGRVGALNVDCLLDWVVTVTRHSSRDGTQYTGSFGGEVRRAILDDTQAGIVFWASAHADVHVIEGTSGDIALISYRDGVPLPVLTESRFWEGVRIFRGRRGTGAALIEGEWSCRPMDARGDDAAEVTGTWRLLDASDRGVR